MNTELPEGDGLSGEGVVAVIDDNEAMDYAEEGLAPLRKLTVMAMAGRQELAHGTNQILTVIPTALTGEEQSRESRRPELQKGRSQWRRRGSGHHWRQYGMDFPTPKKRVPTSKADSDGDGVNDAEELAGTNPNKSDSDSDGFNDGEEHAADTDPLDDQELPEGTESVEKAWYQTPQMIQR